MLSFCVTHAQHPGRAPDSFFALTPPPSRLAPNSHGIISFADPCPLTLLESYRFKNIEGRGHLQLPRPGMPKITSRIHLSFQSLMKCPPRNSFLLIFMQIGGGVGGAASFRRSGIQTFGHSDVFLTYPLSFHTLAHSFALSRTQLFCFQAIPHSFHKTPGGVLLEIPKARKRLLPRRVQFQRQDSGVSTEIGVGGENGPVAREGDGANQDVGN